MMYPKAPQLLTQGFSELVGEEVEEEEILWGGPNSSKMAKYFLKPIMQDESW